MKKYYSSNEELNEILVNNGIDLICNEDMEIIISDDDAILIEEIVRKQAPAAIQDYSIEDMEHTIASIDYDAMEQWLTYLADGKQIDINGEFAINANGKHTHTHIFDDGVEIEFEF